VPAAGQPDVGTGDPSISVAARLADHLLERHTVAGDALRLVGQLLASIREPPHQRVASAFELREPQQSRAAPGGHRQVQREARVGARESVGEVALQACNLRS